MKRFFMFAVAALAVQAAFADSTTLAPGSKAPEFKVSGWAKGEKLTKFEPNKIYVVEFWATWCGPCKQSIPHLTELAKQYKDKVRFTGVSIWENGDDIPGQVKKFVDGYGDKMGYNVAYDTTTYMSDSWMEGAKRNGIPSAFILKGDQIMWIGHPMEMEESLKQIVDGTYDLTAATKEYNKYLNQMEEREMLQARIAAVHTAYAAGQKEGATKEIDDIIKTSKDAKMMIALACMQEAQNEKGDKPYGVLIADRLLADGVDPIASYYAAFAYEATKDYKKAIDTLEAALKAFLAGPDKDSEGMKGFKEALEGRIATAKKAQKDAGSGSGN